VVKPFFCYNVGKAGYFLLAGGVFLLHPVKADLTVQDDRSDGWRPEGGEIISRGTPSSFLLKNNNYTTQ
jgi:hypothetical protein